MDEDVNVAGLGYVEHLKAAARAVELIVPERIAAPGAIFDRGNSGGKITGRLNVESPWSLAMRAAAYESRKVGATGAAGDEIAAVHCEAIWAGGASLPEAGLALIAGD